MESGTNAGQIGARPIISIALGAGVINLSGEASITTMVGTRAHGDRTNLVEFLVDDAGAFGTENYSNQIQFISNNYGVDLREFRIATSVDRGKEWVETLRPENDANVKDGAYLIHLATGVEYTEADLANILRKAGLDYSIELRSTNAPDDGEFRFFANRQISAGAAVTVANFATASAANGGRAGAGVGKDKMLSSGEGLVFQIGANGVADQRVALSVEDMSAGALGVRNVDVATRDAANDAINVVDAAVSKVSFQRAGLGALQNRLEYTVNNLTVTHENLTAAESQIRDTDMAKEMINYTKFNILQQAAQAMLAQANQAPQAVLQLLG
jgi:flagellin